MSFADFLKSSFSHMDESERDDCAELNDLIGMHCIAQYKRVVDRAVQYHDAVILDFFENTSDGELMVSLETNFCVMTV